MPTDPNPRAGPGPTPTRDAYSQSKPNPCWTPSIDAAGSAVAPVASIGKVGKSTTIHSPWAGTIDRAATYQRGVADLIAEIKAKRNLDMLRLGSTGFRLT